MSTERSHLDGTGLPEGLLSSNTVNRTIMSEYRDKRMLPPDMRTRRFGYNPGFVMVQDPVLSGLQQSFIPPGMLILFETAPVSRQNYSVDPFDNSPPDITTDLLAGDGFHAVNVLYQEMGWREIESLRGLPDERAVQLFYMVHPPLVELRERELIEECPYNLDVCITCRKKHLDSLKSPSVSVAQTLRELRESVTVGRTYMAAQWRRWVGEIATTTSAHGQDRPGLRELADGHLYFMRQLHERTPTNNELARMAIQSDAQVKMMREAMEGMFAQMQVLQQQQNPMVATLQAQVEAMQAQLEMLTGQSFGAKAEHVQAPRYDPESPGEEQPKPQGENS